MASIFKKLSGPVGSGMPIELLEKPLSHAERGKLAAERAKLCPKCNKSKAFYFHVRACNG